MCTPRVSCLHLAWRGALKLRFSDCEICGIDPVGLAREASDQQAFGGLLSRYVGSVISFKRFNGAARAGCLAA
jgi:hypothetical protein